MTVTYNNLQKRIFTELVFLNVFTVSVSLCDGCLQRNPKTQFKEKDILIHTHIYFPGKVGLMLRSIYLRSWKSELGMMSGPSLNRSSLEVRNR